MCVGILPILGMGLSIMGAMMEYQAASDQADAQNQYYMQNAREAQRAATDQYMYQNRRLVQEQAATEQEMFENSVTAMERRGTAHASAGEAGVSGLYVDALIGNIFAREGRQRMALDTQYQMNRDNVLSEMDQTRAQSQGRINSVQRAQPPDPAAFLIKGLTGAMGGLRGMGGGSLQIA